MDLTESSMKGESNSHFWRIPIVTWGGGTKPRVTGSSLSQLSGGCFRSVISARRAYHMAKIRIKMRIKMRI